MRLCKCGNKHAEKACPKCYPHAGKSRTTKQRGYGHDWRKLSETIRKVQPLCVDCEEQGKVTPAVHVHHIVPVEQMPSLRMKESNLVPLCEACHEVREKEGR